MPTGYDIVVRGLAAGRSERDAKPVERRLAAILIADVAGYSRLVGADEAGTLAQWKAHWRALIDPKVAQHRGRVVRIAGEMRVTGLKTDAARRVVTMPGSVIEELRAFDGEE